MTPLSELVKVIESRLDVRSMRDWLKITDSQLHYLGCSSALEYYKGLSNILKEVYPNYISLWIEMEQQQKHNLRKTQQVLFKVNLNFGFLY